MKKRNVATAVGVISTGILASYILADKEKRNKVKTTLNDFTRGIIGKSEYKDYSILEEAGVPDQLERNDLAQLENAKMVSEGSQYGVNYYNEVQEEKINTDH